MRCPARRLRQYTEQRPDWHLRLYRTPSGARILVMHDVFERCDFNAWRHWQPGQPAPEGQGDAILEALQRGVLDPARREPVLAREEAEEVADEERDVLAPLG